jgi:N-acetylneuraminic acid mutarotase
MNDLWLFSLKDYKYEKMPENGDIPAIRNGHTLNYFEDKLFVFGGIHDITWELDDLHIYNLVKKAWTTLEQDSPRKIEKKISP